MVKKVISINSIGSSNFSCFCVNHANNNVPAIIIINENLKIDNWIKTTANKWAKLGYLAITPDLSHNVLSRFITETKTRTHSRNNRYSTQNTDYDAAILDIDSIISEIKTFPNYNGNIGIIGFSSGATLAYLSAARLNVDVVVGYYGSEILEYLNEGKNITCPLLLHMSTHDNTIEEHSLNRIQSALIGKENISIYTYDARHGFANTDNPKLYLPEKARLAQDRTYKILATLL
jgi:carboxymethylenebutenolidase